ncbi:transducin family protein/WD-40 repeat family protein [Forsythia ovata]|uniref:Transducin family protein/WD-40 repeat family protein n=1 Tax=Forsythia ovata TaxID=205694 RepID=A0ABD1SJ31_9LAMI
MFAKRLFQKAAHHSQHHGKGLLSSEELDFRINVHYGIPSTASIIAFDPIQRLLAIGTLDGRIKVIGGDNIEGLLTSSKQLPYKYLEFLQNQGFLISVTNDNYIQVWNLEGRCIACSLLWESNVTAFSVISGSSLMYIGDEYGLMSVLKYDPENGELLQLPYHISSNSLAEAAGFSLSNQQPVVGVLPQPCSSGNRVLIAYQSGLIILWDVVEARVVAVQGDKVLQLKNEIDSQNNVDTTMLDETSPHHLEEKEISALCWASSDGSILAVGYIDGDILFWNTSVGASGRDQPAGLSRNVVKLKLSSSEKRIPVIVLHWLANKKSCNHCDGQLLIYGGDEIGSEEVVTVLSLEWSSGMEAVKCTGRLDLTLTSSFADMLLIPSAGMTRTDENAALFVLSNPGRMQIYNCVNLSSSTSLPEKELLDSAVNFPAGIPTVDPLMTVAELFHIYGNTEPLSKIAALKQSSSTLTLLGSMKWPLTGGVYNHLSFGKDNSIHRIYVAGYQDGSVRIWDATYPVFSLLCVLTTEISSTDLIDSSASVTKLAFCSSTFRLAVGNECGLVHLYNLCRSDETSFHFVTENKREVRNSAQVQGLKYGAVFSLLNSGVQALEFADGGTKLLVGYKCSRIAVLDANSLSAAFITDSVTSTSSPLISVLWKAFAFGPAKSKNPSGSKIPDNLAGEFLFVLTKDARIYVFDGNTGKMICSRPVHPKKQSSAISMYVIDINAPDPPSTNREHLPKDDSNKLPGEHTTQGSTRCNTEDHSADINLSGECANESFVLFCCQDSLRIYTTKSVVEGESKSIFKVKLAKPCYWTTAFRKDEKLCGLVVFYQTGDIEIRSLPDLELVKEYSLMSDLRWNFKENMERMISSTNNGHITLANGCEVAFVSLLAAENDLRIPESLPSLHDEVLAAAAKAAISVSSDSKKKQGGSPRLLGGIVKGLKGRKSNHVTSLASTSKSDFSHLEGFFIKNPFPEPSTTADELEAAELDIDDIEIDEPMPSASTLSHEAHTKDKGKKSEREKLLDGGVDAKPRLRTREEIIAKYRNAGDASSVAGQAKNKLLERGEKLEKISRQTAELQSGAEDFASLANELAKAMENRKWYHI